MLLCLPLVLLLSSVVCAHSTFVLGDIGVGYVQLDRCVKYEQLLLELTKLNSIHDPFKKERRELMKSVEDHHDFNICYEKFLVLFEKEDLKFDQENILTREKQNREGKLWGWNLGLDFLRSTQASDKVKAKGPGCWVRQRWTSENMDSGAWDEDTAQWVDFRRP